MFSYRSHRARRAGQSVRQQMLAAAPCPVCRGVRWVCENHPAKPWCAQGCECGAGAPCVCNPGGTVLFGTLTPHPVKS